MTCLFFGCWNEPGHYLVGPGGSRSGLPSFDAHTLSNKLDAQFAPKLARDGSIIFGDQHDSSKWESYTIQRRSEECPQGQFLRHQLMGYTLIQWWDRCQGDKRGACNSTVLLKGEHTSEELLTALRDHFPSVLRNLEAAGVALVEVFADGSNK